MSKRVVTPSPHEDATPRSLGDVLDEHRPAEAAFQGHRIQTVIDDLEAVAHAPHELNDVAVAFVFARDAERRLGLRELHRAVWIEHPALSVVRNLIALNHCVRLLPLAMQRYDTLGSTCIGEW